MPLTSGKTQRIETLPIASVGGTFTHTFDIKGDASQQFLWTQFLYTADATVGTRVILLAIRDDAGALAVSVTYFQGIAASGSAQVLFSQGNTIIPASVTGSQTAIPIDLFVKNDWTLNITDFAGISAGDVFSGFFQVRG